MAAKTELKARIEIDLNALFSELEDISELAEVWDEEPDHMQYAELLTWLSCVGRLEDYLDPAYRSNQMTPEQQVRYRELLRKLTDALPIIDKLGFSRPSVSLDIAA